MELMWGEVSGARFEPWLDEVRDLGFDGVAMRAQYVEAYLTRPSDFARLLHTHELALAGVYLKLDEVERLFEPLCHWLPQVGCADLILYGGTAHTDAQRKTAARQIDSLGEQASKHRVTVSYHHHSGNMFETLEQTEALLQHAAPQHVGLFCDTGHCTQDFIGHPQALRARMLLERNWPRVRYIEFKDWSPERGLATELGQGRADFAAVAELLRSKEYAGWITLEQNAPTPGSTPGACAGRNLQFSKGLFAECRLSAAKA